MFLVELVLLVFLNHRLLLFLLVLLMKRAHCSLVLLFIAEGISEEVVLFSASSLRAFLHLVHHLILQVFKRVHYVLEGVLMHGLVGVPILMMFLMMFLIVALLREVVNVVLILVLEGHRVIFHRVIVFFLMNALSLIRVSLVQVIGTFVFGVDAGLGLGLLIVLKLLVKRTGDWGNSRTLVGLWVLLLEVVRELILRRVEGQLLTLLVEWRLLVEIGLLLYILLHIGVGNKVLLEVVRLVVLSLIVGSHRTDLVVGILLLGEALLRGIWLRTEVIEFVEI